MHWRYPLREFGIEPKSPLMPNAAQILEWFLWGIFMGGGWFIINWLLGKVLH
jgi:hypothetical protein